MKRYYSFLLILVLGGLSLIQAQTYPEVTLRDIQYLSPDTLLVPPHDFKSPYEGDTVIVTGIVTVAPNRGASPDSLAVLRTGGSSRGVYLQDPNDPEYGGILARMEVPNDLFKILDTGTVVKVTGVVQEYFVTTQFNLTKFEPQDVIGLQQRPEPVLLTLDSLVQVGTSSPNYLAEKWEGVYVEIRNVTTADPGAIGNGSFTVFDVNNSSLVIGNQSTYFYNATPPLAGTKLEYIRGYIQNRDNLANGWFVLNPAYRSDIKYGDIVPPNIYTVVRDKGVVGLNEPVTVEAKVKDLDGVIAQAWLMYQINGGTLDSVAMTPAPGDTVYSAQIPGRGDSSLVAYYVKAIDNDGASSTNPSNPTTNKYFYLTLGRALKIADVQYSPFGSGYSGYDSYTVTVSGVVSADTTDIEGDFNQIGPQVYIQDGSGPWTGIWLFGTEVYDLRRGDAVTVTGIVDEEFGVTRIENLDTPAQVVVSGTGTVPDPVEISTAVISNSSSGSLPAESYEGVLVKYSNITVIDENADGNPGPNISGTNNNYGEMFVADASNIQTRMEMQDGTHNYHNFWDVSLETVPTRVQTGDSFESVTGILYFSFSNYKIVPRRDEDFVGFTTDLKDDNLSPDEFALSQNYPNPFNPTTNIEFSVPSENFVTLKIYNILGQEIAVLVNGIIKAGIHKVTFDASDLVSGIYFYSIETSGFNNVKKMLLVK
ncbi:MAG: T9SS type A sorting domain-containing protein [Ignavibacteriales bacterium]|nr:T9SS type A sorting domain-containing protein [Ignavibacteriales bacterium]MCF8306434.1 T9SS type A sorting domain-containing protein [Ignavibacteriales bacterium]MCF8435711.1 T9SS type A sorting domain-containing protein [Ignavibacteriales bacterium]